MFLFVVFLSLFNFLLVFIEHVYANFAVNKSLLSLEYVLASHRAMCSQMEHGCVIDARSICESVAYPLVKCSWSGSFASKDVVRFSSALGGSVSMGSFVLSLSGYKVKSSVGIFGIGQVTKIFE